jgi:hypothetical protein
MAARFSHDLQPESPTARGIVAALDAPASPPVHHCHEGPRHQRAHARKLDYLLEEVRVLREVHATATGRKRIPFTDEQRRRLAVKGKGLTPDEREACCQLVFQM